MVSGVMISPGARDAPKFLARRPEELRRFLRAMEDLWKEAGITDDNEKKESVVKYTDQESEEEWMALEAYEDGRTWEDFKKELLANYPEAAAAERGTPARLRKLCRETQGIRLGDLITLYAFRRSFMAEARKLTKPPSALLNRELVELFVGSLSESMASSVLQFLGSKNTNQQPITTEEGRTALQRRPEDLQSSNTGVRKFTRDVQYHEQNVSGII